MKIISSKGTKDTYQYAKKFTESLEPKKENAIVVALYGDLGSGKTIFVKGVGEAFGIKETITSPTFVIQKKYKLKSQKFKTLYHIDAYRLRDSNELIAIGWHEIVKNNKNIIFIEWPTYVRNILPEDTYNMMFTFIDKHTRKIGLEKEYVKKNK